MIINFPASEGNITPGLHTITIGILEGSAGGAAGGERFLQRRPVPGAADPG